MNARVRLLAAVALGVAAAVVVTSSLNAPPTSPGEEVTSSLDVPFEYFDGTQGNLADFGGRPLVVNFWASWCPACVAEMPDFERVHTRLGEDVAFLGLAMQESDESAARELIEETGVTYELGRDPDGSIFADFGGIAMPTTVFIDRDGAVVSTHPGAIFADDLEATIRRQLLES
ncbi:MAG: TlpA family protein disulfide reductase [Actinomycetota bacterium]